MQTIYIDEDFTLLIDNQDAHLLDGASISVMGKPGSGYRYLYVNGQPLHRIILGDPENMVDHVDRNTQNNCRINLRIATHTENMRNRRKRSDASLPFKGIEVSRTPITATGLFRYRASLKKNGVKYRSHFVDTPLEAALMYDELANFHFGEFAATNKMLGLL